MICSNRNLILDVMIYLNYSNLDKATQQRLLSMSKMEVEERLGEQLRNYPRENHIRLLGTPGTCLS
jgi:hypothetical protein